MLHRVLILMIPGDSSTSCQVFDLNMKVVLQGTLDEIVKSTKQVVGKNSLIDSRLKTQIRHAETTPMHLAKTVSLGSQDLVPLDLTEPHLPLQKPVVTIFALSKCRNVEFEHYRDPGPVQFTRQWCIEAICSAYSPIF